MGLAIVFPIQFKVSGLDRCVQNVPGAMLHKLVKKSVRATMERTSVLCALETVYVILVKKELVAVCVEASVVLKPTEDIFPCIKIKISYLVLVQQFGVLALVPNIATCNRIVR